MAAAADRLEGARACGAWMRPRTSAATICRRAPWRRCTRRLGRTCVPFILPPDSPNLRMLQAVGPTAQKQRYMQPYIEGRMMSAIAISEPGAGGDPAVDEDAGGEGRRPLGAQRPQDLDQPRAAPPISSSSWRAVGKDARAGRHHRLHRREGHAGIHRRARNPDDRRPPHLRDRVRGLPHARGSGAGRNRQGLSRRCSCG